MRLKGKQVVLTGGQGGIGRCLAQKLSDQGAHLTIIDQQEKPGTIVADLANKESVDQLCTDLANREIDILINLAGLMYFGHTPRHPPEHLAAMIQVNLETPIRLTQTVLPGMLKRKSGRIVNIGSVFGALAFPHFSVYSATKAGLRGFSEALRREYTGKGITVTYIAPRAVKTSMNQGAIAKLHARTQTTSDPPEQVAHTIAEAICDDRKNLTIGFPESLFVRINALAPSIIDNALIGKRDIANTILEASNA